MIGPATCLGKSYSEYKVDGPFIASNLEQCCKRYDIIVSVSIIIFIRQNSLKVGVMGVKLRNERGRAVRLSVRQHDFLNPLSLYF